MGRIWKTVSLLIVAALVWASLPMAASRIPEIPEQYKGHACAQFGEIRYFFPGTEPLNEEKPWEGGTLKVVPGLEYQIVGYMTHYENGHAFSQNIRNWLTDADGYRIYEDEATVEPGFVQGPVYPGDEILITVTIKSAVPGKTYILHGDDPRCPTGSFRLELVEAPPPEATLSADIDCGGINLSGQTEVAATVTYTATANDISLTRSFEVSAGEFSKSVAWPETLLDFNPYEMQVQATLIGPYGVHAEAAAEDTLTCNWPGPAELTVDIDCDGVWFTGRTNVDSTITYEASTNEVSMSESIEVLAGEFSESVAWPEDLLAFDPYQMQVAASLDGPYGVHIEAEAENELTCNWPGPAGLTVTINCDGINLSGQTEVGATLSYTATANEIELTGSFEVTTGEFSKSVAWPETLLDFDPYEMQVQATLDGSYGVHAEARAEHTLTCNWPGGATISAYADCFNNPTINITSDDGGIVTFNFQAVSEDGTQTITVEGTETVEPGEQSTHKEWGEELDKFGTYSFTYEANFVGNYGSTAHNEGILGQVCNTPGGAIISVYADCFNQPKVEVSSDDGGMVTYRFVAENEDGDQVIEIKNTVEVDAGEQTIQLSWGESLDKFGEYTFTFSADFAGHHGSTAHDEGSLNQVCNEPSGATLTAYADCFNQPSLTVISDDGGTVTYEFTAISEDGEQMVVVQGTAAVGPGEQTIELNWGENLNKFGEYTFTYIVDFAGTYGSATHDEGTLGQVCNEPPPPPAESWYLIKVETVPSIRPEDPPFRIWIKNWTNGPRKHVDQVLIRVWIERYDAETDSWAATGDAWFVDATLASRGQILEVSGSSFHVEVGTVGPYGEDWIEGNFEIDPFAKPGRLVLRAKVTWLCPYTRQILGNEAGQEIEVLPWGRTRVLNPDHTYTVQRGDNLTAIARSFGTTVQAIVEANGITNPNQIFVGQRLVIP